MLGFKLGLLSFVFVVDICTPSREEFDSVCEILNPYEGHFGLKAIGLFGLKARDPSVPIKGPPPCSL